MPVVLDHARVLSAPGFALGVHVGIDGTGMHMCVQVNLISC